MGVWFRSVFLGILDRQSTDLKARMHGGQCTVVQVLAEATTGNAQMMLFISRLVLVAKTQGTSRLRSQYRIFQDFGRLLRPIVVRGEEQK